MQCSFTSVVIWFCFYKFCMLITVGDSLFWIERMCKASDLVVHQQIVVIHHSPYGYMDVGGDPLHADNLLYSFYEVSISNYAAHTIFIFFAIF